MRHYPGEVAQDAGTYELLSVLGTVTSVTVTVRCGDQMPNAPRGFTWVPRNDTTRSSLGAREQTVAIVSQSSPAPKKDAA